MKKNNFSLENRYFPNQIKENKSIEIAKIEAADEVKKILEMASKFKGVQFPKVRIEKFNNLPRGQASR